MCNGNSILAEVAAQRLSMLVRLSHRLDHQALVEEIERLRGDMQALGSEPQRSGAQAVSASRVSSRLPPLDNT